MNPTECPKCHAVAGDYVIRLRLSPFDVNEMIFLGSNDPGKDWWKFVKRFFSVKHAPTPGHWFGPELVAIAPAGCGKTPELPVCGFCRNEVIRCQTPSLFDDEEIAETEAAP